MKLDARSSRFKAVISAAVGAALVSMQMAGATFAVSEHQLPANDPATAIVSKSDLGNTCVGLMLLDGKKVIGVLVMVEPPHHTDHCAK